ncbi:hypothetical protein HY969_04260 [Candidatus Kaiserbacteria bacterium]|nr:hypothetical protein [Candidatus Kaiserbacteria bacterium]
MARNERTSSRIGTLASQVLSGDKRPTAKEIKSLAAAALTQRPDKGKKR